MVMNGQLLKGKVIGFFIVLLAFYYGYYILQIVVLATFMNQM